MRRGAFAVLPEECGTKVALPEMFHARVIDNAECGVCRHGLVCIAVGPFTLNPLCHPTNCQSVSCVCTSTYRRLRDVHAMIRQWNDFDIWRQNIDAYYRWGGTLILTHRWFQQMSVEQKLLTEFMIDWKRDAFLAGRNSRYAHIFRSVRMQDNIDAIELLDAHYETLGQMWNHFSTYCAAL